MVDYVNGKLPNRVITLTKGCDARIMLRRKDPDTLDPVDWIGDVYMLIDLPSGTERVDGVVQDSLADIVVESDVADRCKKGNTWRVVLSEPGSPTYERALLVGTIQRNDGK